MNKSRFALNRIELIFVSNKDNINIVDEVKKNTNEIALKYETEVNYKFEDSLDDRVQMKMYNHLTPNHYLSDDFFKFYEEFLKYTNVVEEKYSNFTTLPMD